MQTKDNWEVNVAKVLRFTKILWFIYFTVLTALAMKALVITHSNADYSLYQRVSSSTLLVHYALMITDAICTLSLIYMIWKLIENKTARVTAGVALGYMFIPFYNFYWGFIAYVGWIDDTNKYLEQKQSDIRLERNAGVILYIIMMLQILWGVLSIFIGNGDFHVVQNTRSGYEMLAGYENVLLIETVEWLLELLYIIFIVKYISTVLKGIKAIKYVV